MHALPSEPTVTAGSALFCPLGKTLTIVADDHSIIEWESFNIAGDETVKVRLPHPSASALCRVKGNGKSRLQGQLQVEGNLLLINPSGIRTTLNSDIACNGFLASTLDLQDAAFLSDDSLHFSGTSHASVINYGKIEAQSHDIILMGYGVVNNGTIRAPESAVRLSAAGSVTIATAGDQRLSIQERPANELSFTATGINNTMPGLIQARLCELKADGFPYDYAIQYDGKIETIGGNVYFDAIKGKILINGTIYAKEGIVYIQGEEIEFNGYIQVKQGDAFLLSDRFYNLGVIKIFD